METKELNWDALYAREAPRIYNYFRFRLGGESDVEELTARTFEHAWRSRTRYRRDLAAFATWLFKIAQNVGTDYLRGRRTLLVDSFANVERIEKLVASLDVGKPYVPRPCESEPMSAPGNAPHP